MPREGTWIVNDKGEEVWVFYDDLDPEVLPQLQKPIGGFCFEAGTFTSLPLARVPFYVKDWLPKQGRTEIYGAAKAGKSYLAMQVARCIGTGEPFLGLPTTQGRVLLLQFELGMEILQARLRSTGRTYDEVFVGTTFGMKLDTIAGQTQLVEALEAVRPNVLILDPLYKVIRGDEDSATEVSVVLDFLDSIVVEGYNCSVLIMHHSGKDATRGGRGSSVLEGWVDSYIEIKKMSKRGENLRIKLSPMLLRHAELPPDPIEAELKDFEFVITDAPPTVLEQVAGFLEVCSVASAQDILDANIGSRRSVYDALRVLQNRGLVEKEGRGSYKWR